MPRPTRMFQLNKKPRRRRTPKARRPASKKRPVMDVRYRRWWRELAALFALGALAGCGGPAIGPPVREAAVVTVANPVEIEVVDKYYFEGYTAPVSSVDVRSRVTGYLSKIYL